MKDLFSPNPLAATVSEVATMFAAKAKQLASSNNPKYTAFADTENYEWLMSEVDALLEKEEWTNEELATICAIFFLILSTGD